MSELIERRRAAVRFLVEKMREAVVASAPVLRSSMPAVAKEAVEDVMEFLDEARAAHGGDQPG